MHHGSGAHTRFSYKGFTRKGIDGPIHPSSRGKGLLACSRSWWWWDGMSRGALAPPFSPALGGSGCFWVVKPLPPAGQSPSSSRGVPEGLGDGASTWASWALAQGSCAPSPSCLGPSPRLGFDSPSTGHPCHCACLQHPQQHPQREPLSISTRSSSHLVLGHPTAPLPLPPHLQAAASPGGALPSARPRGPGHPPMANLVGG